jgi:hypothetical protein
MKMHLIIALLGLILLSACSPAVTPTTVDGGVTPASTSTTRPSATPTWTPLPTDTATPIPPPSATPTLTKGQVRQQVLDAMTKTIQGVKGVAAVNLLVTTSDGIAIDLSTKSALSYDQAPVSYAVIQALAKAYGAQTKEELMAALGSSDVNIYLTTTSAAGVDRYGSITGWSTLAALAKNELNFDVWAQQASASFKN